MLFRSSSYCEHNAQHLYVVREVTSSHTAAGCRAVSIGKDTDRDISNDPSAFIFGVKSQNKDEHLQQ